MKFDVVIIGGGLAGLTCGIQLQQSGVRCAILSAGQSALNFSSGTLGLLGQLPDDTPVTDPLEVLDLLEPTHPYRYIGRAMLQQYIDKVPAFFTSTGINFRGSRRNAYHLTPFGLMKTGWLTLEDFQTFSRPQVPWQDITIVNFEGFLDFYPQFLSDAFRQQGAYGVRKASVTLPALERLRTNPTEMRTSHIARVFESRDELDALIEALAPYRRSEVVVLPAVFGLDDAVATEYLKANLGTELCLVPTLSPSVPGLRMQRALQSRFQKLGGLFLPHSTVSRANFRENRVVSVQAENQDDMQFTADYFVLASGSFFSKGLVAETDRVYEYVFHLDIDYPQNRNDWYDKNFFAPQPYLGFGVKVDPLFHPATGGNLCRNLYAIGSVLGGFNPSRQDCGGGVAVLSAIHVAQLILHAHGFGS